MTPARDRARGAVMYAVAAAVLLAGGAWWFATAPDVGVDPRMAAWRAMVEELLPERSDQVDAATLTLGTGPRAGAETSVSPGTHMVDVVCAGQGQLRVRLAAAEADSGQVVPCADRPAPVTFTVRLTTEFVMTLEAETDGAVVVRWRLSSLPD